MLDMQNVKEIAITEGDVRTIHDSNDNLLWGKLSYSTKYAGDTTQQTEPTPDAPIPVQVVTGEQTVTISDGVTSQDYTLDLGSTELCKLGTYQDYIYKTGDDWYVHKELSSISFDGSENWNYASGSAQPFRYTITDARQLAQSQSVPPDVYSNYYTPFAWNNSSSVNYGVTASTNSSSLNVICFRNVDIASSADWKTWLSTHNTIVYYPLATPTDTKITDATLISQLDAIEEWMTRYGYTSTITGNLPIIITQTNLEQEEKLWDVVNKKLLEGRNNGQ